MYLWHYYGGKFVAAKKESNREKMVIAMKKGSAVLDKLLPEHIKAQFHVLQVVRLTLLQM